MRKFRKGRRIIVLAAAITAMAGMVTGCSGQGTVSSDYRMALGEWLGNAGFFSSKSGDETYETSTETIGAEENVGGICVNASGVDVKICYAKENGKSVSDGEILIEKKVGKHTPDVDVSVENGVLNIVEPAKQVKSNILSRSMICIYLPEDAELEDISAEDERGDLEIAGNLSVGRMTIDLASGDFDIVGNVSVTSDLNIETIIGMIDIEAVTCGGCLSLYSESGDIEFFGNVQGDMSVETQSGDVAVSGTMGGNLEVNADIGRIELEDITCGGKLTMSTDSGDIEFSGDIAGNLTAETGSGDVYMTDTVGGNLEVNTDIGRIELEDVSCRGSLTLYSDSGDIDFSGEAEGTLTAETGSGDIDVSGTVADDLTLISSVGHVSVYLSGNAWDYNYDISSGNGNLYLNGTVYSDVSNKIKMQNNADGIKITVFTDSGDVNVEFEE